MGVKRTKTMKTMMRETKVMRMAKMKIDALV